MSLILWDRPANKAADKSATIALTAEQIAARQAYAQSIVNHLSQPGVLESLGAFVTPGNDAEKGTIMVALTLPMPALTFTDPDGQQAATRPFTLNINATIPAPTSKKDKAQPTATVVPALSYAELKARQMAARNAKKTA